MRLSAWLMPLALVGLLVACGHPGRVEDFESCVLEHAASASNEMAARMAYDACEEQFERRVDKALFDLSSEQIGKLKVKKRDSKVWDYGYQVYNGLEEIVLRELTIELVPWVEGETWRYTMDVDISPLTVEQSGFDVADDVAISCEEQRARSGSGLCLFDPYKSTLVGARGYRRR